MSFHRQLSVILRLLGLTFMLLSYVACGGGGSSPSFSGGDTSTGDQTPPWVTSVSVSGPSTVQTSTCVNYVATVMGTGNFDARVQWSVNFVDGGTDTTGRINNAGQYCAPLRPLQDPPNFIPVTITATSVANFMRGSVSVQILYPPPVITAISPQPATAGDQITITGQYIFPVLKVVFSDAIGGGIPANGNPSNGNSIAVTVPQGSVTGPVWLTTPPDYLYPEV